MGEIETTKKRQHKSSAIIKLVGGGVAGGSGIGSIILWGGGLALATAIAAFTIKIKKKKKKEQSPGKENGAAVNVDPGKKKGSTAMTLHNPSPSLHHHSWTPFELSKMEIQGKEIVSTKYLISEGKIVLQLEWRHKTANSSKEEIVIFDNLETRQVISSDNHPRILSLEETATIIQAIKDNRKALEHIVSTKQAMVGGREEDECEVGNGRRVDQPSEQIEKSSKEDNEEKRDGYDVDNKEETGKEGAALVPGEMGTTKIGTLQQTVYRMRMQIWVFMVVVVMLILIASPKLITY